MFETDELNIAIQTTLSMKMIVIGSKANFDIHDCSMRGRSSFNSANTFFEAQFSMKFLDFKNWTLLNHRPSSYLCNTLEK